MSAFARTVSKDVCSVQTHPVSHIGKQETIQEGGKGEVERVSQANGKRRKRLLKPHLNETHHNDTKLMACISPEASQVPRLTCFWVGEPDYPEASWGLSIYVQRF